MSDLKKKFPQLGQRFQLAGRRDVVRPVVLLIKSKDALGRPRDVEAVYDEESVRIKGGEEFWVVFSPEHMIQPKTRGDA